jgi:hypothetical protein
VTAQGFYGADRLSLARDATNLVAMRCRLDQKRRAACRNGADWDFCHVHPLGNHEVHMF